MKFKRKRKKEKPGDFKPDSKYVKQAVDDYLKRGGKIHKVKLVLCEPRIEKQFDLFEDI